MMTSDNLKTPTLTQWRKLCEMAGWKRVGEHWYFGDTDSARIECSFLSSDTDALMRLMDELSKEKFCRNVIKDVGRRGSDWALFSRGGKKTIGMFCIEVPYEQDEWAMITPCCDSFESAACDILAQLAVAEGIQ